MTAPTCKTTKAKRPKLPPKLGYDYMDASILHADFNGDGWCDYTLAASYPINSKMNSFDIEELILLGGEKRWQHPLHGVMSYMFDQKIRDSNDGKLFATYRVDLTHIKLIYSKSGGAPYIIGLANIWDQAEDAIGPKVEARRLKNPMYCKGQHRVNFFTGRMSVYRWDDWAGTFKRVLGKDRQTVLDFEFNQAVEACMKEAQAD